MLTARPPRTVFLHEHTPGAFTDIAESESCFSIFLVPGFYPAADLTTPPSKGGGGKNSYSVYFSQTWAQGGLGLVVPGHAARGLLLAPGCAAAPAAYCEAQ